MCIILHRPCWFQERRARELVFCSVSWPIDISIRDARVQISTLDPYNNDVRPDPHTIHSVVRPRIRMRRICCTYARMPRAYARSGRWDRSPRSQIIPGEALSSQRYHTSHPASSHRECSCIDNGRTVRNESVQLSTHHTIALVRGTWRHTDLRQPAIAHECLPRQCVRPAAR